jgi:hypothetical protein
VRLDHLLSKEHLQRPRGRCQSHFADICSAVVSSRVEHRRLVAGRPVMRQYGSFGGLERGSSSSTGTCTLLGPEGSGRPCDVVVPVSSDFLLNRICSGMGECRPYVENYTVDASIFDSTSQYSCTAGVDQKQCFDSAPSGVDKPLVMSSASNLLQVRRRKTRFITHVCDFKFQRANGGCLGNWSRRRT